MNGSDIVRSSTARTAHDTRDVSSRRPAGKPTAVLLYKLIQWQEFRCAITGRELTPENASLDHIIPVSKGGEHLLENIQFLHADVNRAKGTMTMDEFIAMCAEVTAHHASRE